MTTSRYDFKLTIRMLCIILKDITMLKKIVLLLGVAFIMAGGFGVSYTWHIDHRTAKSLSAYCHIDFKSSYTESGALEGAVLTLWDYRYDGARIKPKAILYTDGAAWEMIAAVKQVPPSYDLSSEDKEGIFKNMNKLFVELPRSSLHSIAKAREVRLRFYYDNGQIIDLPLDSPDLEYWKRQLL